MEGTYAGIYQRIVRAIEDLRLAPYDLETYKADPKAQDPMLVGRGQALVGIFKSRYLKRLESSVAAFRISVYRLMEYLLTFRHYIHGNVLLEPTDFWKLLGTIERNLEDDAQAQEHAEEGDDDEERSIPRPRSRHAEIEAHAKAAALLQRANRLPPQTYDIQRLNDALDADLQALRGVFDLVHPIRPADDKKLQRLCEMLAGQPAGTKVLVFTAFRDTVRYLYRWVARDSEFAARLGGRRVQVISGGTDSGTRLGIVQAFAPKSNERPEWAGTEREIDILLSTDVLSEGQNLQDCALLINYDLHWNPTRMIQRSGASTASERTSIRSSSTTSSPMQGWSGCWGWSSPCRPRSGRSTTWWDWTPVSWARRSTPRSSTPFNASKARTRRSWTKRKPRRNWLRTRA